MPSGKRTQATLVLSALLALLALVACGGATAPPKPSSAPPPSASAEPARVSVAAAPAPSIEALPAGPTASEAAAFAQAIAPLRPPSTAAALQTLEAAPADAQAYAHAALAYADTDVPAMTLIWGVSYQAMGGGAADARVAAALAKVLNERIVVLRAKDSDEVTFNLRLAPGQMPVRQNADGSAHAPVPYVFEALFGTTLMGFRPPWTIELFHDVLSSWAALVSTRGTPLDDVLEVNGWLVTTAKAGHLEAFCHQLLGAAFAAELRAYKAAGGAKDLKSLKDYLKSDALRPKRAVMPDDLVRVK